MRRTHLHRTLALAVAEHPAKIPPERLWDGSRSIPVHKSHILRRMKPLPGEVCVAACGHQGQDTPLRSMYLWAPVLPLGKHTARNQ